MSLTPIEIKALRSLVLGLGDQQSAARETSAAKAFQLRTFLDAHSDAITGFIQTQAQQSQKQTGS